MVILNISIGPEYEPNPLIVSNHNLPRYSVLVCVFFKDFVSEKNMFDG